MHQPDEQRWCVYLIGQVMNAVHASNCLGLFLCRGRKDFRPTIDWVDKNMRNQDMGARVEDLAEIIRFLFRG